ncbi:hypothetical protein E2562_018852 [Oryza meyeriana var. granulata]|uniref:Uncharacterized protein n=1 Tax=Oryza meyeriana var. granulata TaxID=110450 RepID=A0A6G1F9W7_9ORYZ|nr:hypothetical protein E2562_018852 [Oryza meyeriana var. granulata]
MARNLSSSFRRGTGAPVTLAAGSATFADAPAALAAGSASVAGAHAALAAAASPPPASGQLVGFPVWLTSSSPVASFRNESSPTEGLQRIKFKGLIAEAVKKLMGKPLFYEDYIRKKKDIARAIGLITTVQS